MTQSKGVVRVLISSAGRRGALLRAFRDADCEGYKVELHACDLNPALSAACAMADVAHQVPRCTDPKFMSAVEQIVRGHRIDLVVPTIDTELGVYAAAAPRLLELGTRVHVSSPELIGIVRDKLLTMQVLHWADVPVPKTCDEATVRASPSTLRWPVFAKPVAGSASRGLHVFDAPDDLPRAFSEPMIFQSRLVGFEYTVNMFVDDSASLRCVIPHLRIQTRAGEVEKGRTVRRADLARIARQIHAALPGARGVLCFQVIDDVDAGPQVFEVNARFGGGYPLAHHAGARFSDWLLDTVVGRHCRAHDEWRDGVTMLRFDDAIFV